MSSTAENTPQSVPSESAVDDNTAVTDAPTESSTEAAEEATSPAMVSEETVNIRRAVEAAMARKAEGIMVLDLSKVSGFTDFFMICHATNDRQVQAITEAIVRGLRNDGLRPLHVEGQRRGQWVLIDYGGEMVIHVFLEETRQFYALERLWGDAPEITEQIIASLDSEA